MNVQFILEDAAPITAIEINTNQELVNIINQTFSICNDGDKIDFDFVDTVDQKKYISIINSLAVEHYNRYNVLFDINVTFRASNEKVI